MLRGNVLLNNKWSTIEQLSFQRAANNTNCRRSTRQMIVQVSAKKEESRVSFKRPPGWFASDHWLSRILERYSSGPPTTNARRTTKLTRTMASKHAWTGARTRTTTARGYLTACTPPSLIRGMPERWSMHRWPVPRAFSRTAFYQPEIFSNDQRPSVSVCPPFRVAHASASVSPSSNPSSLYIRRAECLLSFHRRNVFFAIAEFARLCIRTEREGTLSWIVGGHLILCD